MRTGYNVLFLLSSFFFILFYYVLVINNTHKNCFYSLHIDGQRNITGLCPLSYNVKGQRDTNLVGFKTTRTHTVLKPRRKHDNLTRFRDVFVLSSEWCDDTSRILKHETSGTFRYLLVVTFECEHLSVGIRVIFL